jgi:polyisoprenyl-teichoic acid--peptidoglycan teichoic acid transferase
MAAAARPGSMTGRTGRGSVGTPDWRAAVDEVRERGPDGGTDGSGSGSTALPISPAQPPRDSLSRPAQVDSVADPNKVLRRVLTLAAVSTIVPGLAHLLVGRERSGRMILRAYLCLLALGGLLLVVVLLSKRLLLELAVRPGALRLLEYGAVGVAIAWCLVIISGAFLGEPARLDRVRRQIAGVVVLALCVVVAVPLVFTARYAQAQRGLITSVFTETDAPRKLPDRLNILLLGGDAGADRIGVRTDSVNLASVDTKTGRTVMFSLPRNLQNVPFPEDSALARRFPDGFDCGNECLLNAIYMYAVNHKDLFPGVRNPGAEAVKQAVSATLGVRVDYYVLVNLDGFKGIIDALGGVTIRVYKKVPIGGIAPDGTRVPVTRYIEPGLRELNGYEALWYSRSRSDSDDYARMARQRCVMGAILHQTDPWSVLRNYQKLARSAKSLVSTDIPRRLLPDLVDVALQAKDATITNLQFVPPLIKTADPDFDLIRHKVAGAIEASEQARTTTPSPSTSTPGGSAGSGTGSGAQSTARSIAAAPPGASADRPVDLGSVCQYS